MILVDKFHVRKFILALFSVLSSVLGFEKVQRPTHVNILQCNDKKQFSTFPKWQKIGRVIPVIQREFDLFFHTRV